MARHLVMVSLDPEHVIWLNKHNQRKSNLIRMLLDEYIKTHSPPSKAMDK